MARPPGGGQSFFGGNSGDVGIVIVFRKVRENEIARLAVETFRIAQILAHRVIREMPRAAHHPLLDVPRIRPHFQHFQIVIRFQDQAIRAAQMVFHKLRHVAKVGDDGNFCARLTGT